MGLRGEAVAAPDEGHPARPPRLLARHRRRRRRLHPCVRSCMRLMRSSMRTWRSRIRSPSRARCSGVSTRAAEHRLRDAAADLVLLLRICWRSLLDGGGVDVRRGKRAWRVDRSARPASACATPAICLIWLRCASLAPRPSSMWSTMRPMCSAEPRKSKPPSLPPWKAPWCVQPAPGARARPTHAGAALALSRRPGLRPGGKTDRGQQRHRRADQHHLHVTRGQYIPRCR